MDDTLSETLDLQHRFFVIDETPYCLWDEDISGKTLEFINSVDPKYYEYVADANLEYASASNAQFAALALRTAYSQALETFFALLGALLQAPWCVPAWAGLYRNSDLRNVIGKIHNFGGVLSQIALEVYSWDAISEFVHTWLVLEDKDKEKTIKKEFGRLWSRFATDFLNSDFLQEYNSIKHGLRVRSGGFQIAIGVQDEPGKPAPPERVRLLGKSDYGTSYFTVDRFDSAKHHIRLTRHSRNWHPEDFGWGLHLISMSIANVLSALKILNGVSAEDIRYFWPNDFGVFNEPWKRSISLGVTSMSGFNIIIRDEYIKPFTKETILSRYKDGKDAGIRRITFTAPKEDGS